ncbi:MAG: hypothetical protein WCA32_01950 [Chromatiaceae bacterium]
MLFHRTYDLPVPLRAGSDRSLFADSMSALARRFSLELRCDLGTAADREIK